MSYENKARIACPRCRGNGRILRTPSGAPATSPRKQCPDCDGRGTMPGHGREEADDPGARPNTPPRYRAEKSTAHTGWRVSHTGGAGWVVCTFFSLHPDAQDAAEREAAWLNREHSMDSNTRLTKLVQAIEEHRQRAIYQPQPIEDLMERIRNWDRDLWAEMERIRDEPDPDLR